LGRTDLQKRDAAATAMGNLWLSIMSLFFLALKIVGILVASVGTLLQFAKEDSTVDNKHRILRWFPKRLRGMYH
jgi:hypothetical protein